jgi:CubicO group peptidase (beta-lactamase class C family)
MGLWVRDARRATVARRGFPVRTALLALGATVAVPTAGCTGDADPPASSAPQNSVAEHADRSDELLARFPPDEPGCSSAVGIEGEVVWAGVQGVADLSTGRPIETSTTFAIASVSKQFTATVVLLLVHEGLLTLDDPLSTWLPDLPPWSAQITVGQAMHNVTGLPDYVDRRLESGVAWTDPKTVGDSRSEIAAIAELDFPPGNRFQYSNSNYFLLGEVVRTVTGQSVEDVVRARIFEPLGLAMEFDPSGWDPDSTDPSSARGYVRNPATGEWEPGGIRWETNGDAGIQTTPSELVRWADNYRTGEVGGSLLLDDALPPDDAAPYGAGIFEDDDDSLGHGGAAPGHLTEFFVSADRTTAIAVACNADRAAQSSIRTIGAALKREWTR